MAIHAQRPGARTIRGKRLLYRLVYVLHILQYYKLLFFKGKFELFWQGSRLIRTLQRTQVIEIQRKTGGNG